jgi:opacity protein-like surface antigen
MKQFPSVYGAALLAALSLLTNPGYGQNTRFYVKADLGGNITQDTELREYFGPVSGGSKVKFDPGFRFGVGGGYQLTPWFAPEVEFGTMQNFIHSITDAERVDALFSNVPFLVNAKFQWPSRCPFTPYIGGGVGVSISVLDVDHISINDIHSSGVTSDAVFAYQGFAGIRYKINEQMGLSLEYRYFATESPSFEADFSYGDTSDRTTFGRAQTHAFSIAFDYRF